MHFRKLTGIKKMHHFRFVSSEPGVVYYKRHSDEEEVKFNFLKRTAPWSADPTEYPVQITPKGLSAERQWYLYDQICEFCPEEDQNITCPEPTVPRPTSRVGTPVNDPMDGGDEEETSSPQLPPTKKIQRCGTCRREGHNSKTCPDREH